MASCEILERMMDYTAELSKRSSKTISARSGPAGGRAWRAFAVSVGSTLRQIGASQKQASTVCTKIAEARCGSARLSAFFAGRHQQTRSKWLHHMSFDISVKMGGAISGRS